MDTAPWHAERSFLRSGWYDNDSYSTVLPNLQRLPQKAPLAELSSHTFKNVTARPYSAEISRRRRMDPVAEPFCRIRPLPMRIPQAGQHILDGRLGAAPDPDDEPSDRVKVETVDSPFFEAAFGDEAKLAQLLNTAPGTECVRLASHRWLSPDFLASIGSCLPRLQELSLRNTHSTDAVVAAVVAGCSNLRVLDLGECELLHDISRVAELRELRELRLPRCANAVTSELVGSLRNASKLEVLDLSFCPNLGSKGLQDLATGCRCLRWLCLSNCARLGDDGVLALVSCNAGIEHLSLALNMELSDHIVGKVVRCLKRLQFLDLSGCSQLSRITPLAVAKHCEYIEDVSFASITQMGDEEVKPIFSRCSRLRSLDITGCQNISAEVIFDGLPIVPKLKKLVLSSVPSISEEFANMLRREFPECTFEQHARRNVDPDDLTSILRMPPKGSILQTRGATKSKVKAKKSKKG